MKCSIQYCLVLRWDKYAQSFSKPTFCLLPHLVHHREAHDAELRERESTRVRQELQRRTSGLEQSRNRVVDEAEGDVVEVHVKERVEQADTFVQILQAIVSQNLLRRVISVTVHVN